jgi:hypothetical protein
MNKSNYVWMRTLLVLFVVLTASTNLLAQQVAMPTNSPVTHLVVPIQPAFRGNPASLVWVVVLVGFVTASFVQWAKDFLRWRYRFHRHIVHNWVVRRSGNISGKVAKLIGIRDEASAYESADVARKDLEMLAGGEHIKKFQRSFLPAYALPTEQLCGQLISAAEITVAAPNKFPELFAVLTAAETSVESQDFEDYRLLVEKRSSDDVRYADLRAVFMIQAQRSLDNLQIEMGRRWKTQLTLACLGFSFVFGLAVVLFLYFGESPRNPNSFREATLTIILISLAGALAAPIAHDLMRAIRSFRR